MILLDTNVLSETLKPAPDPSVVAPAGSTSATLRKAGRLSECRRVLCA